MDEVSTLINGIFSNDSSLELVNTSNFMTILSSNINSPIVDQVIQSGAVSRFVEFLNKEHDPMLQNEATCVLAKIASKNAKVVIDHGAIPILVRLASDTYGDHDDLCEEATLALGNVAGDSLQSREHVLSCGALKAMFAQMNEDSKYSMVTIATQTLANLCIGQPPLLFDQVKLVLEELGKVLDIPEKEILANACWACYHLSYGSRAGIQSLIEAGLVPRLLELLQNVYPVVLVPAISTIGNIVSGDNQQTQYVINSGVLRILANMLNEDYDDKIIDKQACWTVSNITAGTIEQIQSVIDAKLIPILVMLAQIAKPDVKKEAIWAISNATLGGSHVQIKYLVGQNCIKPLCDNLVICRDPRIIVACLDGLENILKVGEVEKENTGGVNCCLQMIEDAEGLEKMEKLQSHEHNEIYEKAVKILETYWP